MEIISNNQQDVLKLISLVEGIHTEPPPTKVSEFVEGKRVLPQDTPYPGPWRNAVTPYLVEIMDCFAPASPVRHVAVMKGAQIGLTTAMENVIAFNMAADPSPIMVMSATEAAVKDWGGLRLEPTIDSFDMRIKLSSSSHGKGSRQTGDTSQKKTFPGGYIVLTSAQTASKMRSYPIKILCRDEIDGSPTNLTTGEGNWLSVSEARTNSQEASRKIFDLSTPTTLAESNINRQYLKGDQRKFNVPCPHCNEKQVLEFGGKNLTHGLKPIFEDNLLVNAYYECIHCHEEIYNHHKTEMLKGGEWVATAQPQELGFVSYHLSSLYSPIGFMSWTGLYQKYLNAKNEPDGMRSFTNLYLGLPYKEKGVRPKLKNIIELAGDYKAGTIPPGVLFLTASIDVQSGKNSRIEMEIRGHGRLWRTWSIDYRVFHGAIDNPMTGAWLELAKFSNDGGFLFKAKVGKKEIDMPVRMIFIDSGDGTGTDTVYQVCRRMTDTYPIKGRSVIKKDRAKTGDAIDTHNFWPWKASKIDEETTLINISTNYYKNSIYSNLNNSYVHLLKIKEQELPDFTRSDIDMRPAGFCDFPLEYDEKYFAMLTAEERREDGSYHCPGGRRNEALDLAVYNSAAADFYLNRLVRNLRDKLKAGGASDIDLDKVNTPFALDFLELNPS